MNLVRNPFFMQVAIWNVGGRDYAPPAYCRRPAHVTACAPAYVEVTGSPKTNEQMGVWPIEPAGTFPCEELS